MPATARPAAVSIKCLQLANSKTQGLTATVSHRPIPRAKHLGKHKGLSIHNKAVTQSPVQPAQPGTSHAQYHSTLEAHTGYPPGHLPRENNTTASTGDASQPAANPCGPHDPSPKATLQTRRIHTLVSYTLPFVATSTSSALRNRSAQPAQTQGLSWAPALNPTSKCADGQHPSLKAETPRQK